MEDIDNKLKELMRQLNEANKSYQEKFITPVIEHQEVPAHDFFELALAQDTINLLETQYELSLAKKFPQHYTPKSIDYLKKEEARFKIRVECWKNRQFPSRSKSA